MQRIIIFCLCFSKLVYGNLPTTTVWEIRPLVGNDSNGGCFDSTQAGTDYTQQNAAQFSFTDLVLVTSTTVTSVSHSFISTDVGNCVNIISGTGFTSGFYEIISVSSGTATLDRSAGTPSSIAGVWAEGGALASPVTATIGAENGVGGITYFPAGQKFWLMSSGTFTQTSTLYIQGQGDPQISSSLAYIGYTTARGDGGFFSWTTATNSTPLITLGFYNGSNIQFSNISFSNTASVRSYMVTQNGCCASNVQFFNDIFDGFSTAIDNSSQGGMPFTSIISSEIKNSISDGIQSNQSLNVIGCYIHNNGGNGIYLSNNTIFAIDFQGFCYKICYFLYSFINRLFCNFTRYILVL